MSQLNAYWCLLRLNKPVGILLLWYPTAWALWAANGGAPPLPLLLLFLMGTVLMRSAGCVVNDIADRNIDRHVARTQARPLTSGAVSLQEAFVLLFILLGAALLVLINLPQTCFYWALIALFITVLYPFCKRFMNAPQMVLGFAFSMGMPMAYVASNRPFDAGLLVLFLINFAWIIAYDTMYAMADREDDLKIGVKSTAIYFAQYDRLIIGLLLLFLHCLWFYLGVVLHGSWVFYTLWFLDALVLLYQQKLIVTRNPQYCFNAFKISVYYGAIMWLALVYR